MARLGARYRPRQAGGGGRPKQASRPQTTGSRPAEPRGQRWKDDKQSQQATDNRKRTVQIQPATGNGKRTVRPRGSVSHVWYSKGWYSNGLPTRKPR